MLSLKKLTLFATECGKFKAKEAGENNGDFSSKQLIEGGKSHESSKVNHRTASLLESTMERDC